MFLEEGKISCYLGFPFSITIIPPCLRKVGMFGFASHRHIEAKICFVL